MKNKNINFSKDFINNISPEYVSVNRISINKINFFFSSAALKKITEYKITTLGEFLTFSDLIELNSIVGEYLYEEIKGTAKILKCKFLYINPLIDENDTRPISVLNNSCIGHDNDYNSYFPTEEGIKYVRLALGFSKRGAKELCRNFVNLKDYFMSTRNNTSITFIKNLGKETRKEVLAKTQVILDYHDNKKNIIVPY